MAGPEQPDEGATPRELVLEASRRDNVELLQEVIDKLSKTAGPKSTERVAEVLNNAFDGVGNHALHLAATHGSYEVMDLILDQEGVEVDPIDRFERDTPLHKAVRFVNSLPHYKWEGAKMLVNLLIDAGADPRVRNKAKLKPADLVDPANNDLRLTLRGAEYAMIAGDDIVNLDDDANGGAGSASDSD
ncbi:MAG: hypothetical protein M1823_004561 [Watsoniomyces obsoletus]|nr:MAG: hypothetical protein M1823_004561 [Watsoniomyces obsoletus]